ncbi:pantoate--beta-alanine ligase [Demequina sp. NBRC 110052]|uniref:pantoate--beta-alanine ligase n=1 Tax=Demequina sp. NBRC 110052 TaxID=1570341 RepID=UPI000A006260|nr:pantoate--beta-alanine ligase [Demequina sp. NBRC 110052]
MRFVTTPAELDALAPFSADGSAGSRAVVMTMGALHEGHLALVRAAREANDQVVATIFVNPLQFDDANDLQRYPRTLEADAQLLEDAGVDVLFAPNVETVYPGGDPVVRVSAGTLGDVLEGAHRPGHFDGVLTVVLKLLNLTRPDRAYFGQKDAQQLLAIRAMVRDLNVPVDVIGVPTQRDPDGLALSSRNVHLSASERASALSLSRSLEAVTAALELGEPLADALTDGRRVLDATEGVQVDYLEAMNPADAQPLPAGYRGDAVIAVAARVGATRLIDNVPVRIG